MSFARRSQRTQIRPIMPISPFAAITAQAPGQASDRMDWLGSKPNRDFRPYRRAATSGCRQSGRPCESCVHGVTINDWHYQPGWPRTRLTKACLRPAITNFIQQSVWANDLLWSRLGRRNRAGCGFSLSICQPCVSSGTYS